MQQKTTWMRYLITGISFAFVFFNSNCKKTSEYKIKSKWTFINLTDKFITYEPKNDFNNKFNLKPNDTLVFENEDDGSENPSINSLASPFRPNVIIYNNLLCDTLIKENSLDNINNFFGKKIKTRTFEYTFFFTPEMFARAKNCK